MKKIWMVFLTMTLFLSADITWQKSLPVAFEMAKKEYKTVMVFVEGKHCRWCKKMKHRTLADESIDKKLQSYVLVKVFHENKEAAKLLPHIDGVPSIFFMTADKKLIQSVVGYYDVFDFTSILKEVEAKSSK